MKGRQILIVCLTIAILGVGVGCDKKSEDTSNTSNTSLVSKSNESQKLIMDNFDKLMRTSPNEKDVIKFIKDKASLLSKSNVSRMVLSLEDLQNANIKASYYPENGKEAVPIISEVVQRQLQSEIAGSFSMDIIPSLKNTELKNALNDIVARGYKIWASEGMFDAMINYEFYKQFNSFVTDDIKDYIDINAVESNNPSADDAALVISPDEVFNRAAATESFIKKYPKSEGIAEVKKIYAIYVSDYLYGQNNTPAFDYQTKKLDKKFQDSYLKTALKSGDSDLAETVARYLPVLENNDYKRTDAVEKFIKDAINKLNGQVK